MATVWKYIKYGVAYIPIYENTNPNNFDPLTAYEWALVFDHTTATMNNYSVGQVIYRCDFANGNYFTVVKYSASQVRCNWYLANGTLWTYKTFNIGASYPYRAMTYFHDTPTNNIFWYGFSGLRNEFDPFAVGCPAVAGFNKSSSVNLYISSPPIPNFIDYFEGSLVDEIPKDPYADGGDTGDDSTPGQGGTGDFDNTSDIVPVPALPTLSAIDTGFITLYNPSLSNIQALATYMWGTAFDLTNWKKLFADPMDAILGLSVVPVQPSVSGSSSVKVGNIDTGVSMPKISSQYVTVNCGTLNVNEYWGAYLDYSPYTKAYIYLPFIGTHAINVDDIMGKSVNIVYHIDVMSGACVALILCGGTLMYEFIGQCAASIPISGQDWTTVIGSALSIAGSIGSMVATGGASAPMAAGSIAQSVTNIIKPEIEKSGGMSGMGGMLSSKKPFMILERPKQAVPKKQNEYTGYPVYITRTLSSLSGYTEVDVVHLENVPATDMELIEIEQLLKTGVII